MRIFVSECDHAVEAHQLACILNLELISFVALRTEKPLAEQHEFIEYILKLQKI